ncbi:MAG TPA: SpoIID/LytB domain-containing protein [bacterium]|nr:SpoIID/LytB domain-containing protein [bacterium]
MTRLLWSSLLLVLLAPAPPGAASDAAIRVGILREQGGVVLMSDRPIDVLAGWQRASLPAGAHEIVPGAAGLEVPGLGDVVPPVRFTPTGEARLFIGIRPYRGVIELRRTPGGRITVINELPLEAYLYGVLKMEVDPSWPVEALKAQAVAARTLALYHLGRYRSEGYDVRATTDTQVYGGVLAEDPRTVAAVEATRGEILVYQGRPILAVFHSDSGGMTESSEYVWGGRYPYLRGVPDPYTAATPWSLRVELRDLEERLRRAGKLVAGLRSIAAEEFTPSGRVATLRLAGAGGTLVLKATELRTIVGPAALKSTLFNVRTLEEEGIVEFSGRGSGHGVGMSQWGARGLALQGRGYEAILRHYYADVTLTSR